MLDGYTAERFEPRDNRRVCMGIDAAHDHNWVGDQSTLTATISESCFFREISSTPASTTTSQTSMTETTMQTWTEAPMPVWTEAPDQTWTEAPMPAWTEQPTPTWTEAPTV